MFGTCPADLGQSRIRRVQRALPSEVAPRAARSHLVGNACGKTIALPKKALIAGLAASHGGRRPIPSSRRNRRFRARGKSIYCLLLRVRFFALSSQRAAAAILPLLLVCGSSGATPLARAGAAADSQAPHQLPDALRAVYIASVQTDAARSPDYRIDPASRSALNPRQKLAAQLSSTGIRLTGTDSGAAFHAALSLRSYGCAGEPVAVHTTPPQVAQNRVEYVRSGLTEWYVNGR